MGRRRRHTVVLPPCPRDLLTIYQCFSDETRLRILNVLLEGALHVRQIQDALSLEQPLISRHLAYLRRRGIVRAQKQGRNMMYWIVGVKTAELEAQLDFLQTFCREVSVFRMDLNELARPGRSGDETI
jgi:ArsR family transcriptional regulator